MGKKNARLDGVRFNLLPNSVGQTADGFEVERHPEDEKRPYNYDPNGFLRGNNAVLVPSAVVQKQARPGVKSQNIRRHVVDNTDDWDMDGLDDAALERDFPTRKPKRMTRRREEELRKQEEVMRRYQATQDGEMDDEMFDHAEEADFDVDFIQQMIYGEVGEDDEEDVRLAGLDEFGMPKKKAKSILKKSSGDAEDGDEEEEEDEEWDEEEEDYDWDEEEWDEDGEDEVAAAEKYNLHAPDGRAIDRQYQRMLREFEVDAKINNFTEREEDLDPRTRGPLEIKQYVPLLQEFAEDNAGFSHLSDDPLKHKGLINQLRGMTRENRVFDTDKEGEYVISILPDKATRKRQEFRRDAEDNKDVTIQFIRQQEEVRMRGLREDEDVQASHAVLDHHGNKRKVTDEDLPKRMQQRYDVETILTTASTAFNHPNVIAAGAKKKLNMREAMRRAREGGFAAQKAAEAAPAPAAASSAALPGTLTVHSSTTHADPNMGVYGAGTGAQVAEEASVEESEDEDDMDVITIDPTQRPKDESKEEKRIRKEIVKQMQREKRMQKKVLGSAYKSAEGDHAKKAGRVKQDKALISLSLARN